MNIGFACVAALCVGLSKAGFSGISLISVFIFADLFGKNSVGLVLPLLIVADLFVYPSFRAHGSWRQVWGLLAPAMVGLAIGWWVLVVIDDQQAKWGIGASILLMVGVQSLRLWNTERFDALAHSRPFGISAGVCGGMATMIANAAGPVVQLYLISKRLPKMELLGISSRFFLLINVIKLPFNIQLQLIDKNTLLFNALLIPAVGIGIFCGRSFVRHVPQQIFEALVLGFSTLAGIKLCFF